MLDGKAEEGLGGRVGAQLEELIGGWTDRGDGVALRCRDGCALGERVEGVLVREIRAAPEWRAGEAFGG